MARPALPLGGSRSSCSRAVRVYRQLFSLVTFFSYPFPISQGRLVTSYLLERVSGPMRIRGLLHIIGLLFCAALAFPLSCLTVLCVSLSRCRVMVPILSPGRRKFACDQSCMARRWRFFTPATLLASRGHRIFVSCF